jgi:hypothetical protein
VIIYLEGQGTFLGARRTPNLSTLTDVVVGIKRAPDLLVLIDITLGLGRALSLSMLLNHSTTHQRRGYY